VSPDSRALEGWVTSAGVMGALAHRIAGTAIEAAHAQAAADPDHGDAQATPERPAVPLPGYHVAEVTITSDSPAAGRKLGDVGWPAASVPVSLLRASSLRPPRRDVTLVAGDRVSLLIPATDDVAPGNAEPSSAELPGREPGIAKERAN
jgi:hypothetical protein